MVRLAMVGIGGYGWELVEVIGRVADDAGCRLVGAADARFEAFPERAAALTAAGAELFGDALAMFDALRGRCDAVYIATGIPSHAALTVAAAEAGYHVHLEKPPAATVQELDAMLAALARAGRFCLVGFQALHGSDIRLLEDRAVSGALGQVRSLTCHAGWPRDRGYYARNGWAGRLRVGDAWALDGPAMNALAHQVTNMLFLASPAPGRLATPTSVRAELYAAGPVESHDTAAIEIRTAEGPTARFLASHCTAASFGPAIAIEAEGGRAEWQMWRGGTIRLADGTAEPVAGDKGAGRPQMVANFVEAVRAGDGSLLRCPLAETRQFVLALDGAHESSRRIHRIAAEHARRIDAGTDQARTVVAGLDELLVRCAEAGCLPSDLGDAPPWAVATEPFDLAGYSRFPQAFGRGQRSD